HLLYYTLRSLSALLERHGLELFHAYWSPIHGGSLIAVAGHPGKRAAPDRLRALRDGEERAQANELATYHLVAVDVPGLRDAVRAFLPVRKTPGGVCYGLGARVKGITLRN